MKKGYVKKNLITTILFFAVVISSAAAELQKSITLSYGAHERNTLDLWQAKRDTPCPLLIYIHGGGWLTGDKQQINGRVDIAKWLKLGISVASIDYRLSSDAILPAPVHDAARALQFLRYKAKDLNLNPSRIAIQAGSAGGCSALWILFHDDLADPSATDPVLRESTRVQGVYGQFPQSSIDPLMLNLWIGEKAATFPMIYKAVGATNYEDMIKNYKKYQPLLKEFSPLTHMDKNDPPLYLSYPKEMTLPPASPAAAIHHGMFGIKLKEKADEIGYTNCTLQIPGTVDPKVGPLAFLAEILLK
jgi:arylformamidase